MQATDLLPLVFFRVHNDAQTILEALRAIPHPMASRFINHFQNRLGVFENLRGSKRTTDDKANSANTAKASSSAKDYSQFVAVHR